MRPRTPDDAGAAGLAAALDGLAGIVSGDRSLEEVLEAVAALGVGAIPGADGAGLTLSESGRPDTVVASDPFVRDVDAAQYRLGEGPCLTAVARRTTTTSGGLGADPAWPEFGPLANALGVDSVLSLPLIVADDVLGSLNVYAFATAAFTAGAIDIGQVFATQAAIAVYNARRFDQTLRLTAQLETALADRAMIDQAIGIVRARSGLTSEEAFTRLRILSQQNQVKLARVAAGIVAESVARARARVTPM